MDSLSTAHQKVLHHLIISAGNQAFEASKQAFDVFEKGVDDYVTEVDRQLDFYLSQALKDYFPQDGVVSEEDSESFQAFQDYQRLWLIDPIDGTEDYIHHRSYYSVMIGLLQSYQPLAGWIYAPAFQKLYWGGLGYGLFEGNGKQMTPLQPCSPHPCSEDGGQIIIGDRDQKRFGTAIVKQLPSSQFYSLGSFGLKVLEIIQGHAGLYLYCNGRVKLWDTTGPIALAQAAGLTCCDLDGNPLRFTPDAVSTQTMTHYQPIVVGWPDYVEALLPQLKKAVTSVGFNAEFSNPHQPKIK